MSDVALSRDSENATDAVALVSSAKNLSSTAVVPLPLSVTARTRKELPLILTAVSETPEAYAGEMPSTSGRGARDGLAHASVPARDNATRNRRATCGV